MIRIFFTFLVLQLATSDIMYSAIVPAYSTILNVSNIKVNTPPAPRPSLPPIVGAACYLRPSITPLYPYIITSGQSTAVKIQQSDASVSPSDQDNSISQQKIEQTAVSDVPQQKPVKPVDIKPVDKVQGAELYGSVPVILNNSQGQINPPKPSYQVPLAAPQIIENQGNQGDQILFSGQGNLPLSNSNIKRSILVNKNVGKALQGDSQSIVIGSTNQQVFEGKPSTIKPVYQQPIYSTQKGISGSFVGESPVLPVATDVSLAPDRSNDCQTQVVYASDSQGHNSMIGENNVIGGDLNKGEGDNNLILGCKNMVMGNKNSMSGELNAVKGSCNMIHGNNNFVMGSDNAVTNTLNSPVCDLHNCGFDQGCGRKECA